MKTILDQCKELCLESICENEMLVCRVVPFKSNEPNKVPSYEVRYDITFEEVSSYIVLEEVIEVALGNKFVDDKHLTECEFSELAKLLQIKKIVGDETKHFVLRTAHCIIHVFTERIPRVEEITVLSSN